MAQEKIPVIKYNEAASLETIVGHWWKVGETDMFRHVFAVVKDIENRQIYRKVQNLRHARLYSNMEVMGLQAGMFSRTANDSMTNNRVTLNVIGSCIDTIGSKIAKARPRPLYLTQGGDWSKQERAKKLTKYTDGLFDQMQIYPQHQRSFLDSGIFGTGETKFYKEDGRVKCQRTLIDEIVVDDADAMYGTPSQKHQIKYMSKDSLIEMFPDKEEMILGSTSGLPFEIQSKYASDIIRVIESWHLPSAKGASDGMHGIFTEKGTLHAKQYRRQSFPATVQRWKHRISGYFGMGIAEELIGLQLELNTLLRRTQLATHLMCVPRVWVENNSMVNTGHINNEIGGIGKYTGNAPIFNTAPAMSPEVYQQIENYYKKAYEIVGVSQLSANSQKPAGLDAAVALRTYQDIESERFQLCAQRYEEVYMDAARLAIELTEELAAEGKDPFVMVKDGKETEIIHWSEVKMDSKDFTMRVFPTSMLPTQPAAKLQTVQELTQAGFFDKETAMSLLDFPDIDAAMSPMLASYELIKKMLCKMLENGKYQSPEPFMKLPQAKTMAQNYYLKARTEDAPEERLELLRRFMNDCDSLIQAATPQASPQAAPGLAPMAPQAAPEAAPNSPLIPNAPQGAANAGLPG